MDLLDPQKWKAAWAPVIQNVLTDAIAKAITAAAADEKLGLAYIKSDIIPALAASLTEAADGLTITVKITKEKS